MEAVLAIFAAIDDPRDHTAQYELPALLFLALAATLCGARSCVDIADFAAANRADLAEVVDLPADATPSHDTFSRCSVRSTLSNWKQHCVASAPPCAEVSASVQPRAPSRWTASACAAATNAAAPTCHP